MRITVLVCVFSLAWSLASSFQHALQHSRRPGSELQAGFGGGGAVASKKKSKTKKNSNKRSGTAGTTSPFDAGASLLRMEKVYDELSQNEAKRIHREEEQADDDDTVQDDPNEIVTAEYIVATRAAPVIADWVPVAQIILARPLREAQASEGAGDALVRAAVSHYCREISHVAGMGSRVFGSIPRNDLQYAVESVESFHKHVYEVAVEGKHENAHDGNNEQVMSKTAAREFLQLNGAASDIELSDVKRSYRKMSMEWHPDRFVGESDETKENAAARYAQIKLAYETLQSGVRNGKQSWYESLGGRARTDFSLVSDLMSIVEAETVLTTRQARAAVCGLDPDLVQTFVARSQAAVAR